MIFFFFLFSFEWKLAFSLGGHAGSCLKESHGGYHQINDDVCQHLRNGSIPLMPYVNRENKWEEEKNVKLEEK